MYEQSTQKLLISTLNYFR